MSEYGFSVPIEALVCNKHATFTEFGKIAVRLLRMKLNGKMYRFTAKTDGAFFLRAEGDDTYGLWMIAPDNSLNFTALARMTVDQALETLAAYNDATPIPGWADLAEWLSGGTVSGYVGTVFENVVSIIIGGLTTTDVPEWQNPHGNISVFLRWIKRSVQAIERDEGVTFQMSTYQISATKFSVDFSMLLKNGETANMAVILQI